MPHAVKSRILFIDAYDSFSNNIISLLETRLNVEVTTIKIDEPIACLAAFLEPFSAIVAGPGPGDPRNRKDVGLFRQLWRLEDENLLPVLGICLGFQSLVLAFGGKIKRLPQPRHGIVRKLRLCDQKTMRKHDLLISSVQYHSLHASIDEADSSEAQNLDFSCPPASCRYFRDLIPLAWDCKDDNTPLHDASDLRRNPDLILMAVKHRCKPFHGIQFHAESICSSSSAQGVIADWWNEALKWRRKNPRRTQSSPKLCCGPKSLQEKKTPLGKRTGNMSGHFLQGDMSNRFLDGAGAAIADTDKVTRRPEDDPQRCPNITCYAAGSKSSRNLEVTTNVLDLGNIKVADICQSLSLTEAEFTLLDSEMHQRAEVGQHSIIGLVPPQSLRFEYSVGSHEVRQIQNGRSSLIDLRAYRDSVFTFLKAFMEANKAKSAHNSVPFWGGLTGYINYEAGLETIGINKLTETQPRKDRQRPDISFVFVERSIVIDHFQNKVYIQSIQSNDAPWIKTTSSRLATLIPALGSQPVKAPPLSPIKPHINLPDETKYKAQVLACQGAIGAGDSYELCVTTRATITTPSNLSAWPLYVRLRSLNPAPFAAYMRLGNLTLLSSSPERFLHWTRSINDNKSDDLHSTIPKTKTSTCQFRPIKGTIPKQPNPAAPPLTHAEATALLSTPKERAENLMIVDLIRHDLHGVVGPGNVTVPKLMVVEEYATVYQLVSVIEGRISTANNDKLDAQQSRCPHSRNSEPYPHPSAQKTGIDILASSLPPGSMTGAPKLRSCQLLRGLEARERGVYAGVLGYMDVGGGGDFSVVIRSVIRWDGDSLGGEEREGRDEGEGEEEEEGQTWSLSAGGAVTALSTPEGEYEEMTTKMRSVLRLFQ